jgi:phosphopantetheinyl transferase
MERKKKRERKTERERQRETERERDRENYLAISSCHLLVASHMESKQANNQAQSA